MKTLVWSACVIVPFIFSSAIGDIMSSGDRDSHGYFGDGGAIGYSGGTVALAHAVGTGPYASYGGGEGWQSCWATEYCIANWKYRLYACVEVQLSLWDSDDYAFAVGDATAYMEGVYDSTPVSASIVSFADVNEADAPQGPPWPQDAYEWNDGDEPGGISRSYPGSDFYSGDGFDMEHSADACTGVSSDTIHTGDTYSYAQAWATMEQVWP